MVSEPHDKCSGILGISRAQNIDATFATCEEPSSTKTFDNIDMGLSRSVYHYELQPANRSFEEIQSLELGESADTNFLVFAVHGLKGNTPLFESCTP